MATNAALKNQIASKQEGTKQVSAQSLGLKALLNTPTMQKKFEQVLDKKAPQFMSSLLNLYNGDPNIQAAEPMSIISSAMVAASLDLPVDKNLGYAWIVPFYDSKKGHKVAQFQLGYKGYIQLALRTGQYKAINVIAVHEGELIKWNRLTEEIELDLEGATSEKVIGYCGYFKLINGFEKTVYWTKDEIEAHRIKHNKMKDKNALNNVWKSDYDAMAMKTVIRNMLSKWGILSIEMQTAVIEDEKETHDITDETNAEEPEIIDYNPEPEAKKEKAPQPEQAKKQAKVEDKKSAVEMDENDLPF
ncbi:recombinase RecT [Heyndrickxia coagulans]|uniref:Recombination protein RecT n=1 Tax=Heyndrickxia coagulans DSM 1 = ATCC 7050 TaxID=1121088 RepID=A0A0B5X7Z1_HEYCO|nr:recombinase RecT [Heyndrickxia coagulans]AJH79104.1 recombinase, phage RecT family protein [Heyndrickxia coagulans DSM 1 = ATCC 7050]AJH80114.1 recombinase, phage RecT family protein [Heyndrickxia coagulans DSM 1 = ATCC 7050]MCR2847343.1 recombinase RecT [Heyndrickxia coagulans]MDR4225168.1 recombinase RecT [Heyndrickxia coagulans DSM 1 = ATCC 7050]MED4492945.1 recombinase RecT [Heyndrickxia coagulans]